LSPGHSNSIVPLLGFDRLDSNSAFSAPLAGNDDSHFYFDNLSPAAHPLNVPPNRDVYRSIEKYERGIMAPLRLRANISPGWTGANLDKRIESWLIRGAIREDDNGVRLLGLDLHIGQSRKDDPYGEIARALGHFYDPLDNTSSRGALRVPQCGPPLNWICAPSTEWALGRNFALLGSSGDQVGATIYGRRNHFTWEDARSNYWWALTLKRDEGSPGYDAVERLQDAYERRWRFATAIKSVGHVLHLLQDSGQPQHTRNDGHAPPFIQALTPRDKASDAAYEEFTDARLARKYADFNFLINPLVYMDESAPGRQKGQLPVLHESGEPYPVPRFTLPVKYFTTKAVDVDINERRGLADYSNRGYFTNGTLPKSSGRVGYDLPVAPGEAGSNFMEFEVETQLRLSGRMVKAKDYETAVRDELVPGFDAQLGSPFAGRSGRIPIVRGGIFSRAEGLVPGSPEMDGFKFTLHYQNLEAFADALLPRTIGYSTGLIDYFFRGRLELTPTAQNAFAVMNQGEAHTVDADGYPRRPDQRIFGFDKVRLKVRNITPAIVESGGTGASVNQGSGNGQLVAVARYHRNACYRPDMTGQRVAAYGAPPLLIGPITEPTCSLPKRTDYQEISVSAPITIGSESDLPGGNGTGSPAAVEKVFDFSVDPIPVNATDLFLQVVYRGQLGEEPDGIAIGTYDVREPAFVGIWNNTDFYWSTQSSTWLAQNGSTQYGFENVDFLRICVGSSTDSRWAYVAETVNSVPPLGIPSPDPGSVRLAILHAIPSGAQQFIVRVTPGTTSPSPPQRSYGTRGTIHQASHEKIPSGVLDAPQNCSITPPTPGSTFWCHDPIHKRRGINLGHLAVPIYFDTGNGVTGADVDSVPLSLFPGQRVHAAGTLKYNEPTLSNCPAPPASVPEGPSGTLGASEIAEILELAADEGVLPVEMTGAIRW